MAIPGYKGVWESIYLVHFYYFQDTCQPLLLQVSSAILQQKQEEWLLDRHQHACLSGIWYHYTAYSTFVPRPHWREAMVTDKTVYFGIHKDLGQRPKLIPFTQ